MAPLIGEQASQDFNTISERLGPQNALKKLEGNNYGIVVNAQGEPLSLVIPDDLRKIAKEGAPSLRHPSVGLPPTIFATPDLEIEDVAGNWSYELSTTGCRGAIVLGERGIEGVVPSARLRIAAKTQKARTVPYRIWNSYVSWMLAVKTATNSAAVWGGALLVRLGGPTGVAKRAMAAGGSQLGGAIGGESTSSYGPGTRLGGSIGIRNRAGEMRANCARCGWENVLPFGRRVYDLGEELPWCERPESVEHPKHKFAWPGKN